MPNSDPTVRFREVTELSDLVITGELSLQDVGRIVTSTATGVNRIILSATAGDRLLFQTADSATGQEGVLAGGTGGLLVEAPTTNASDVPSRLLMDTTAVTLSCGYPYGTPTAGNVRILVSGTTVLTLTESLATLNVGLAADDPSTFDPALSILTGTTVPTVGTGANALESGVYTQMGSQVIGHFTLRWSSNGTSGNGTYCIDLPKRPATTLPLNPSVGSGRIFTSTGNREWLCDIRQNTSKKAIFRMGTTAGLNVTDNVPAIWVNSSNNRITGHLGLLTTE